MTNERDLKVARLMLRLQVGADGDALDNEILKAYEALPESSIIRNDWLRRRFLIGHLLEREGISALLGSIAALGGPQPAAEPKFVPTEIPAYDDAPAAQLAHAQPAAEKPAGSPRKRMKGLMPVLPPEARSEQESREQATSESEKTAQAEESATAATPDIPEGEVRAERSAG